MDSVMNKSNQLVACTPSSEHPHTHECPPPQCHHMSLVDFMVLTPGHCRSVTDFWGWDAHEAQLHCPDVVWVVIKEDVLPGGALNLNSTNLPRPWSPRESTPSRKIPTVEPGIEPGTSLLVVRDSDHYSTRLVTFRVLSHEFCPNFCESGYVGAYPFLACIKYLTVRSLFCRPD